MEGKTGETGLRNLFVENALTHTARRTILVVAKTIDTFGAQADAVAEVNEVYDQRIPPVIADISFYVVHDSGVQSFIRPHSFPYGISPSKAPRYG